MLKLAPLAALALTALASPAFAEASIGLSLTLTGNAEITTTTYNCEGREGPLGVEYVNAAPNFLALIPVEDQTLVFVSVVTASGARYESGQYVWWNRGSEATLSDVTEGLDAAPLLMCTENVETP